MAVEINVNVKIEGLNELVEAIKGIKISSTEPRVEEAQDIPVVVRPEKKKAVTKAAVKKEEAEVVEAKEEVPTKADVFEDITEMSETDFIKPASVEVKEPAKEITINDLRALGAKISAAGKTNEILAILNKYEVRSLSAIPEDKRNSFYEEASRLVG